MFLFPIEFEMYAVAYKRAFINKAMNMIMRREMMFTNVALDVKIIKV